MMTDRGQRGFTLLEMLIVVAILAILFAILIPNFIRSRAASQLAACQLDLRNIAAALQLYSGEHETYPLAADWETDLTAGGYIRGMPRSPIDGAAYVYATDAGRSNFVLSDGPDKYLQAGVSGYIVYTPAGGLEVGIGSVPSP
ncbi:MAG: type II secretion system protein [bacterium]